MASRLQQEIQQKQPFATLGEEVWLNLSRTAAVVAHGLEHGLRVYKLSLTQYNVLRILRGAGTQGLCQYKIRQRLVAEVPDVPRILDRMEKAGWVHRTRGAEDRRQVITALTDAGSALVEELDGPMDTMLGELFPRLTDERMTALNELLVEARALDESQT